MNAADRWDLTDHEREWIAATVLDVFTTTAPTGKADTGAAARLLEARIGRLLGERGERGFAEGFEAARREGGAHA